MKTSSDKNKIVMMFTILFRFFQTISYKLTILIHNYTISYYLQNLLKIYNKFQDVKYCGQNIKFLCWSLKRRLSIEFYEIDLLKPFIAHTNYIEQLEVVNYQKLEYLTLDEKQTQQICYYNQYNTTY